MKIYVQGNSDISIHIRDIVRTIDFIAIVDDIESYRIDHIFGVDEIDYSKYSDDELLDLSSEELSGILDLGVLLRLVRLAPKRLTDYQCKIIDISDYRLDIDDADIEYIMNLMKSCDTVKVEDRGKYRAFKAIHNFTDADVLNVIHSLTKNDFVKAVYGLYGGHRGNTLLIFQPKISMTDKHNVLVPDFEVYIKIDESQSLADGTAIIVISFHTSRKEEKRQKQRDKKYEN